MEHIYGVWTLLMLKILQAHLLRTFVANLKIYTIYALCPEIFCNKNLAIRKVFAFSDSDHQAMEHKKEVGLAHGVQHLLVPGLQKQRLANID